MGSVYRPTRQVGDKRVKYKCYRIAWQDEHGQRQTEKAFTDKAASEALLRKREQEAERKKAGLLVPSDEHKARPLESVEAEYLAEMSRLARSEVHRQEMKRLLTAVRQRCGWTTLGQVRPDALVRFLAELQGAGRSPRTLNAYRDAALRLMAWCVEQKYLSESPLAGVKKARSGGKRTKPRRAYTMAELSTLLGAAPAHRLVYLVAALSGLRRGELRQLQKRDLTPTGDRPSWHLRPEIVKGRRLDRVPMLPECAAALLPVWSALAGPTDRVFRVIPSPRTLTTDLGRAGVVQLDAEGRCLDLHSLRYFFCREMAKRLPIVKVQRLMRHRDIRLTANLYADLGIDDVGEDVWALPSLGLAGAPTGAKPAGESGG